MKLLQKNENGAGRKLAFMLLWVVVVLSCQTVASTTSVIYENDFSRRTSAEPIPSPLWQSSVPYHTGELMFNYSNFQPFEVHEKIQDGWAKGNDGNHTKEADFVVRVDEDGNQFGAFINDGAVTDPQKDHNTRAIHPFYNSITTGVLRAQVDMRAPSSYPVAGNNNFFFGPYYRKYVELDWGSGGVPSRPGMFGFNQGDGTMTYIYGGDGRANFDGTFVKKVEPGHWYRFVVDFDFNARTLSGCVYDMGTETPTWSTTGAEFSMLPSKHFHTDPNDTLGPVEGFCLADAGSVSGRGSDEDLLKACCVDNIRLSWRPLGTDFGLDDIFYENDFSQRRSRTIVPGSSATSFAYEAQEGVIDHYYNQFPTNRYSLGELTQWTLTAAAVGGKVTQPYGLDGWRRLNSDGAIEFSIANLPGDGGNRLVVSGGEGQFGIIAQALGTHLTTGDVKFAFDFRLPDRWYQSSRWFYAMIAGDDYLNSSSDAEQAERYAVRLGVRGDSDTQFICANRDINGVNVGAAATANHFYRGVITVHLDASPRTVDTELYDLGSSSVGEAYEVPADQQPVFARTGDTIRNRDTFSNISCIAFYAAGVGGRNSQGFRGDSLMFIDNLKVWKKTSDAADWNAVYSNNFKTRVRYAQPAPYPLLTSGIGRLGKDGWVKRNNAGSPLLITSGNGVNPSLFGDAVNYTGSRMTSDGSYAWTMQQLGVNMQSGRITVQVDMRPPRTWIESGKISTVILGNDLYFQGVQEGEHQFLNEYQIRFGFSEVGGNIARFARYDTTKIYYRPSGAAAYLSAAVNPTHWYRFKVKSNIASGTYDLWVYDLGTTHPTFETPTPSDAIGEVKAVPYSNALSAGEGISTLGVTVQGVRDERTWEIDDPGLVLVDNIRITHVAPGSTIIIR